MPEPVFGVVLVNWNGADDTVVALDSLLAASPRPACVVVVDNGSAPESVERIAAWGANAAPGSHCIDADATRGGDAGTWLTIIRARENLGFGGGNNLGLRFLGARAELSHFLLLNNDAMVAPDYFARLRETLREEPDAGLVGCTIFHHPDRERVWFSGAREIPWRALILHRYDHPTDAKPQPTTFVTGCAMLISRAVYEAEGGLADCFNPIYWEDSDYSCRARAAGFKLFIAPSAHVYHRVRSTGGGEQTLTPRVAFLDNRNRVLYVRRNYRGMDRARAMLYLAITKPGRAAVETLRGRRAVGSAIIRGFLRGLLASVT
jgi:GT2 family glycosyltransferase